MDSDLVRYLNDHLAGSAGAVDLIQSITDSQDDPEAILFFSELKSKVEDERIVLKSLIAKLGHTESGMLQMAGTMTAKAAKLKLMWEGLGSGELGIFEGMEALVLGIQGKHGLWLVLREIAPWIPEWEGVDFLQLEQAAIAQRDSTEVRRIAAGLAALVDPSRRTQR